MKKHNLETKEGRRDHLIEKRKSDIKKFEGILNGNFPPEYQKYKDDKIFLEGVKRKLETERILLKDLLEIEF